jgi:gliding motility-associated-like protein
VNGTGLWSQISGPGTTTFSAPSSGNSSATASAAGTYVYQWTISNGNCISSAQVTVNYYNALTPAIIAVPALNYCGTFVSTSLGGNIPVTGTGLWTIVSGGTGTFSAPGSGSSTFTANAYGTYVLRWTISSEPCTPSTADVTVTFNQNLTLSNAGPDQTGASMCGKTSATLAAVPPTTGSGVWSIISGTGGIIASPDNPSSLFSGIAGATYILHWTVSNEFCSPSTDEVIVKFYGSPTVTGTHKDVLCFGASDGTIDITPAGGTGPFTFLWTGTGVVTSAEDQSGLAAGSYSVVVADANGCTSASLPFTISQPSALSADITSKTNVSVFGGNDGSVSLTGTGGTSPYEYQLGSGAYQVSGTFSSLTAGSYIITIRDVNLCTFPASITITQPAGPLSGSITSIVNVACYGALTGSVTVTGAGGQSPYSYKLGSGSYQSSGTFGSLAAGNYIVTILDAAVNTFEVYVTITQPAAILTGSISANTNVLCYGDNTGIVTVAGSGGMAPYKYKLGSGLYQDSGTFGTLSAGYYTIEIKDANDCNYSFSATILQPVSPLSGSITSQTGVSCFGSSNGTVTVTGSGGNSPYEYSLNGGTFQTSGTFSGLAVNSYSISVRDANLCSVNVPVTITQPSVMVVTHTEEDATCRGNTDGSIIITATGGTPPYTAFWKDGVTTLNKQNISDGTYNVVVTDKNGCAVPLDIVVGFKVSDQCIEIPDIITPNDDTFNDTWVIKNIDLFPNAEVFVYNRWGILVYRSRNISANPWDGRFGGELLPTDSYHYVLHLNDGSAARTGVISIIR